MTDVIRLHFPAWDGHVCSYCSVIRKVYMNVIEIRSKLRAAHGNQPDLYIPARLVRPCAAARPMCSVETRAGSYEINSSSSHNRYFASGFVSRFFAS